MSAKVCTYCQRQIRSCDGSVEMDGMGTKIGPLHHSCFDKAVKAAIRGLSATPAPRQQKKGGRR